MSSFVPFNPPHADAEEAGNEISMSTATTAVVTTRLTARPASAAAILSTTSSPKKLRFYWNFQINLFHQTVP